MSSPASSADRWREYYARRLAITDLLVLVWVVYGAQIAWFGLGNAQLSIQEDSRLTELSYWWFSGLLVLCWSLALSLVDSRDHRVIGTGPTEYVRVANASLIVFGAVAVVAFLTRTDVARGFLLISLPLGIIVLVLARWLWRQWLIVQRSSGKYSARVLLVGSFESAGQIARQLQKRPGSGYTVVGACVPGGRVGDILPGTTVPVMGRVDAVSLAIRASGADTVAVTSTDELPPDKVKEISWGLDAGRQHLVLAPSIVDVAGPRIHIRPVAGLPLIHVETPKFTRGQRFVKRIVDVVGATVLLIVLSPLLALVGILVKASSPGRALFRQERIGWNGQPFQLLKFRTMRSGAEKELSALLRSQGSNEKPLFKVRNDPRITPIGRFLRKYSIDELPQLFNVLAGTMSLVGPRPQVAAEVSLYSNAAHRRLLTRPGMTGLWQVSGRSSLGWDEAVTLDLYYVENWSFLGDLAILAKTIGAVLRPGQSAH